MGLIRGDGYVFIDGKRLDEPYIETERWQVSADYGPITIPQGEYFVMAATASSGATPASGAPCPAPI